MIFDINNYDISYCMLCATVEEAQIFAKYLHLQNKRWSYGESYLNPTTYKYEYDVYFFNDGTCDEYDNAVEDGYEVLNFSDFEWNVKDFPKLVFNIDDYEDCACVMHCDTKEKADVFVEYLHDLGLKWYGGDQYLNNSKFYEHGTETCYNFHTGKFGDKTFYEDNNYFILYFDDFDFVIEELNVETDSETVINEFLGGFSIL